MNGSIILSSKVTMVGAVPIKYGCPEGMISPVLDLKF